MTLSRATLLVALASVLVYANALPNGFAYDDTAILAQNPLVTEGQAVRAWTEAYWPGHSEGSGLYRPLTVSSFALEWSVFGANPFGYHAVNVAAHAGVGVLLVLILAGWTSIAAALVGGLSFAVHPLHTEAVANIVGRNELYAALLVLAAVLLYRDVRPRTQLGGVLRILGIGVAYFLALCSKEIAVTLPGLLVLVEWMRSRVPAGDPPPLEPRAPLWRRVLDEAPVFGALVGALAAYLACRFLVLGTLLGELPAPELRGLSGVQRVMTGVSLWPEYVRLLVAPLSLSADYSPAVLFAARQVTLTVALGGAIMLALAAVVARTQRDRPLIALGVLWFGLAILPVSQLLFPTGVLLAERTLYLPSVGFALLLAGLWSLASAWAGAAAAAASAARLRTATWVGLALLLAFSVRTWERNPTWMSSFTVLQTLARDHPESSLALRSRAAGLARAGELPAASEMYEAAVQLAPDNYALLTEVGHFYIQQEAWENAERTLVQATSVAPLRPGAYRLLAQQYLLRERYREGHRTAIEGLRRAGPDSELYALVSESYVARPDLTAAIRARRAALALTPHSVADLRRLADLLAMSGDTAAALQAREQADQVEASGVRSGPDARPRFTPAGRILQPAEAP